MSSSFSHSLQTSSPRSSSFSSIDNKRNYTFERSIYISERTLLLRDTLVADYNYVLARGLLNRINKLSKSSAIPIYISFQSLYYVPLYVQPQPLLLLCRVEKTWDICEILLLGGLDKP